MFLMCWVALRVALCPVLPRHLLKHISNDDNHDDNNNNGVLDDFVGSPCTYCCKSCLQLIQTDDCKCFFVVGTSRVKPTTRMSPVCYNSPPFIFLPLHSPCSPLSQSTWEFSAPAEIVLHSCFPQFSIPCKPLFCSIDKLCSHDSHVMYKR